MFENLDPTRPLSHLKGQQRCREAIHPGFQTTPRRSAAVALEDLPTCLLSKYLQTWATLW